MARMGERVMNGSKTNSKNQVEREDGGQLREEKRLAYPYGGVLG